QHGSRTIGARSQNVKSRSVRRLVVLVGFARLGSTEVVQPRDDLRLAQQQLDHRSLAFALAHPTSLTSWTKKIPCLDCPVTCFGPRNSTTSGDTRLPTITCQTLQTKRTSHGLFTTHAPLVRACRPV